MSHTVVVPESAVNAEVTPPENLATWITEQLAQAGHPNPQGWLRFLRAGIDGLPDQDYQMFEINRAWRVILARISDKGLLSAEESMNVRYTIIDKCPVENWKQAFKEGALPCIVRLQLPIVE